MTASTEPFVSIIVPAYNEAFHLDTTLRSIFESAQAVGVPYEVLVVNDASTDDTAAIARQAGARVIDVHRRQIAAVRNAGAREAKGNFFIFIDADTWLPERTLRAAIHALQNGAIGGGSRVTFGDEAVAPLFKIGIHVFSFFYMTLLAWAAGCFIFATRRAFEAVGGFDETLYACEEVVLSIALKRQGRFRVLREHVITSGRKIRLYSPWLIISIVARFAIHGMAVFRQRQGLELWYDGKREKPKR